MSVEFKSKAALMRLLSLINEYTGSVKTNLTDAVKELKSKSDKGYSLFRAVCGGTVEELTAEDLKGITKITNHLFFNNTVLRYLELPDSVTELGDNCFYGCTNFDTPCLPDGIRELSGNNFYNCSSLSITKLPDELTYIGNNVFTNCANLRISEIPAGVTYIGRGAFSKCTSIETITFKGKPDSVISGFFSGCTNLRTINVPWAEGELPGAPWGATNATVNYNYTE